MAWASYIKKAQKAVERIDKVTDQIGKSFHRIKVAAERDIRSGLKGWLELSPKNPREKTNAFVTLSGDADYKLAYRIIEDGFAPIRAINDEILRTDDPSKVTNIHEAQFIMEDEANEFVETLGLNDLDRFASRAEALGDDWAWNIVGVSLLSRGIKEQMTRAVSSSLPIATISKEIDNWDINENQYELSTTAHPRAIVRNRVAETIASVSENFDNVKWTVLSGQTASGRVRDMLLFGLFTSHWLDKRFKDISAGKKSVSDWRGLGLGFRTNEYYIPVPTEDEEEANEWSKQQRKELNVR